MQTKSGKAVTMIEMTSKADSETTETAVAETLQDETPEDVAEETRDERSCCFFKIVFLDLLEDLVRDRFVVIFVVLFLLTMIVFSGSFTFRNDEPYVERVVFAAPPQYSLSAGIPSGRTPRLQALMSDSRLPPPCKDTNSTACHKIHAEIVDLVTSNNADSLDCSFKHLADVSGTLEGERLREVCSASVINGVATLDERGLADFPNFAIHGPAGRYLVKFGIDDAVTQSDIKLVNPVVALRQYSGFLTYSEKMHFDVGKPLRVQPTILVLGTGLRPLEGVTVKAFASSVPVEEKKSTLTPWTVRGEYPFPGERHATLTHATAVSNAQGLANFTELTVAGTSDRVVYISFFANGKLLSWSGDKNILQGLSFRTPLIVNFDIKSSVSVNTHPSSEVSEGMPFEQQPSVKVTPASAGRIVYAMVVGKDGIFRPGKATSPFGKPEIAIKRLVNAKAITDKNGIATFKNLAFQAGGNAGNYIIEFWSEGVGTSEEPVEVQVKSSIAQVQVSGETKISGDGDATRVQQTAIVSLKLTNSDRFGCPGKTPTSVKLLRSVSDGQRRFVPVSEETEAAVRIAAVPSHNTARAESAFTGEDGIVQLNVYFTFITANASAYEFFLRFEFENGAINSKPIGPLTKAVAADQAKTANLVSSFVTILAPPEQIVVKQTFVTSLQLRNSQGSANEILRTANNEGINAMICQVAFVSKCNHLNSVFAYTLFLPQSQPNIVPSPLNFGFRFLDQFKFANGNPQAYPVEPDGVLNFAIAVTSAPPRREYSVSWRLVAFTDTSKRSLDMDDEQLRDCVCQGSMFSQSAFSVGRTLDTAQTTCGEGTGGIIVTAVSDMFTSRVANPVNFFIPVGTSNRETGEYTDYAAPIKIAETMENPIFKIPADAYYSTKNIIKTDPTTNELVSQPQHRAEFQVYFMVLDKNGQPMNDEAKDVKIQWVEVPQSVSLLDIVDAKYVTGGQQVSDCPSGGSVFPNITAAGVKCFFENQKCDEPTAEKITAYGRVDRVDPTCSLGCIDNPFILLTHRVGGSYTLNTGEETFNGVWDVRISINSPGRYAIRLEVDGVTSPILFFQARSKAAKLEIWRQAKTRFSGNASNPGDVFEVQPVARLLDADGNPVQGERVQFDFVNDDGSLAPASGDLSPRTLAQVLAHLGGESDTHGYPQVHNLGSRRSRPTGVTGFASFDYAGFVDGRSGCYRMVFSVPVGDGTSIYAKRKDAPDSEIFISDPVCLVNEDGVKVAGEPNKLGAVGSLFEQKATFKLEYDLQGNSTGFGFKRRFWKRLNVDLIALQLHSQQSVRKLEPLLDNILHQGSISKKMEGFRTGDGIVGKILTNEHFANTVCLFYMGVPQLGGCRGQNLRKPAQKVDTTTNAFPEAVLYDIDDGSIELVYSCEYIPYVANVPGAPDTEWIQLRNGRPQIWTQKDGSPYELTKIPANHDPLTTRGVPYDAQAKWETYHQKCTKNFGVNTRPPANCSGRVHRLRASENMCQLGVHNPASFVYDYTDEYSSLPLFSAGIGWATPTLAEINVPGIGNIDLSNILTEFGDFSPGSVGSYESASPAYAERLLTSSNAGLPLVLGRKTSAYAERIKGPKLTFDNIKSNDLRLKSGHNKDQLTVKLYGGLIDFMPNAFNLRTIPLTSGVSCKGPGTGLGEFGDCCDDHSECSEGYVCHPVEHACTIQCSTNHLYISQLMSAARQCPGEPLTQLSLCQPMTKTVSKKSFIVDKEGAARLNTTAAEYVWLCRARKAVGNSFSPFCSTCRGLSLYEHPLADWNNGSVTTSVKEGVAANWVGNTELQTAKKKKVDMQRLFELLFELKDVPSTILDQVLSICKVVGLCAPIQQALDMFSATASSATSSVTQMIARVIAQVELLCEKGPALLGNAEGLATICKKSPKDILIDTAKCLGEIFMNAELLPPEVTPGLAALACVIDQAGFDVSEDDNEMTVALKSGVFRPIIVDSSPANVFIMANPPSTVVLREPFILSVQVTIQSGAPLPGQLVTIHIGNSEPTKRDPRELFLESSGSETAEIDPKLVTAVIDPLRTTAYTGTDGIARFRLRFLSGLRGQYTVYAKAGQITSPKSNAFFLANTIARVEWVNSVEQNLTLAAPTVSLIRFQDKAKVKFPAKKKLEVQPKIRVLNEFGQPLPPNSDRQVIFMLTRYQSNKTNVLNEALTLRARYASMNALERAQGIFQLFMQGARKMNFIPVTKPKATVVDNKDYTQNSLGEFAWNDLMLSINEPAGKYRMAIVVDGVSSPYSDVISVTVQEPTKYEYIVIQYLIQFCIFIVTGLILIGNSTWHSPFMLLTSAIVCILCIILAAVNYLSPAVGTEEIDWTKNLLIIFLSAVLVWGVKIMIVELLTQRRNVHDADARGLRPRKSCTYFCYNFSDHRRYSYFRYVRRMFHMALDSKSEKPLIRPKGANPSTYQEYTTMIEHPEFPPEELVEDEGKCIALRRLVSPKSYNAFFLPQRVLLSFFAAVFVLAMMFINVLQIFNKMETAVYNAGNIALSTLLAGLAAFVRFVHESTGTDLYDIDGDGVINNQIEDASELQSIMTTIAKRFTTAYIIGFVVSTLLFLYSWVHLVFSFRAKVLNARRGIWTFNPAKVKLADAANFTGISVSNGLASFVYFTFIFTFLVFFLIWPVTYEILWYAITTFWYVWVPMVAVAVATVLFKKIVLYNLITKQVQWEGWQRPYPGDFLLCRACFHLFDLWELITRLVTGVITAIVRLILAIGIALITLPSAATSPLPAWVERYTLLDQGSKSFQAAIKAYHRFNNPIFRVACWLLVEDSEQRRLLAGKAGTRVSTVEQMCGKIKLFDSEEKQDVEAKDDDESDSSKKQKKAESEQETKITVKTRRHSGLGVLRWRLAIMLHRFPQLRYYRAHYLAQHDPKKPPNRWKQQVSRDVAHVDRQLSSQLDAGDPEVLLDTKATTGAAELASSLQSLSGMAMLQRKADSDHGGNIAEARAAIIDSFQAKQRSVFLSAFDGCEEKEIETDADAVEAENASIPPLAPSHST